MTNAQVDTKYIADRLVGRLPKGWSMTVYPSKICLECTDGRFIYVHGHEADCGKTTTWSTGSKTKYADGFHVSGRGWRKTMARTCLERMAAPYPAPTPVLPVLGGP